jgi:hypothetical protein
MRLAVAYIAAGGCSSSASSSSSSASSAPSAPSQPPPASPQGPPLVAEGGAGANDDPAMAVYMAEPFMLENDLRNFRHVRKLKAQIRELDIRFRQSGEKIRKVNEDFLAKKRARTRGLLQSMRAMKEAQNSGSTQSDTSYRHAAWVKQMDDEGAGLFTAYLRGQLEELKAVTTDAHRSELDKALALILAAIFSYADSDFKWPHGSNLMFVLSLLTHSRKVTNSCEKPV